jgi:multimeric flavodoxin WrbA
MYLLLLWISGGFQIVIRPIGVSIMHPVCWKINDCIIKDDILAAIILCTPVCLHLPTGHLFYLLYHYIWFHSQLAISKYQHIWRLRQCGSLVRSRAAGPAMVQHLIYGHPELTVTCVNILDICRIFCTWRMIVAIPLGKFIRDIMLQTSRC